jgi:hypothetical protein
VYADPDAETLRDRGSTDGPSRGLCTARNSPHAQLTPRRAARTDGSSFERESMTQHEQSPVLQQYDTGRRVTASCAAC